MVDIKKLQSLLFEDDAEEEDDVNFTAEQPLAHENTTQITIDPAVFAEPEEEAEEPAEEIPAEEVPAEEPAAEAEQISLFDEIIEEKEPEESDVIEDHSEDVFTEEHEETEADPEELPVFGDDTEEEAPAEEATIEDKIDAIVFGDDDNFSDIDDLFAEFAAAADLNNVEAPVEEETPEEVVFPSDPVMEETEPQEEEVQEEVLIDVPKADDQPEEAEETAETTNIVDFFSDIAGEDIPENVANEKTAPLDLDSILGTQPAEETPAETVEEEDYFEEKLTIEEEPVKPAKKEPKKEFVYHFQPIISPLFGTDLSESQTTKKHDGDVQIIVTSNLEVHDDAPTEILDTHVIKDDEDGE